MAHALLDQQGMKILSHRLGACALLSIMLLPACNKSNPAAPSEPPQTPASTSYVVLAGAVPVTGASSQFTATAVGSDGAQTNVTSQATWRSSNEAVVSVAQGGMVRAVAIGSADVSATYNGVTGSTRLNVAATPCTFALAPMAATIPASGGSVTIAVNNVQGEQCQWSAQSSGFLRIEGAASGNGSGTLVVAADPNTGASRVAAVSVAGASVTISQDKAPCVWTVSPQTQAVTDVGGTFYVVVTAPGGCGWAIESSASFITVNGPLSRSGTSQVYYQVAPNPTPASRTATIRIDDFQMTVTQAPSRGGGGDR